MTVYNYDDNNIFIGISEADESPLEPGVYLDPAKSTRIEPPSFGDGFYAYFDGEAWEIKEIPKPDLPPDVEPIVPVAPSLDVVKLDKIQALSNECQTKILSGFDSKCFDGVNFKHYDSELIDQIRISGLFGLALSIASGLVSMEISWKASGELMCYPWTPMQILALAGDLKSFIEANTDRFYKLRIYALDEARTMDEIVALTWDTNIDPIINEEGA